MNDADDAALQRRERRAKRRERKKKKELRMEAADAQSPMADDELTPMAKPKRRKKKIASSKKMEVFICEMHQHFHSILTLF